MGHGDAALSALTGSPTAGCPSLWSHRPSGGTSASPSPRVSVTGHDKGMPADGGGVKPFQPRGAPGSARWVVAGMNMELCGTAFKNTVIPRPRQQLSWACGETTCRRSSRAANSGLTARPCGRFFRGELDSGALRASVAPLENLASDPLHRHRDREAASPLRCRLLSEWAVANLLCTDRLWSHGRRFERLRAWWTPPTSR